MPSKNPFQRVVAKIAAARDRHAARHRPSEFRFALADSVGFLHAVPHAEAPERNPFKNTQNGPPSE